jgi:serine protease AprX
MSRRTVVASMATVLLAAPLVGLPSASAAPARGGAAKAATREQAPPAGDRDHDHVSDDFAPTLAAAAAGDRLGVIVTGLDAAQARGPAGSFRVTRRLPMIDGFAATLTAGQVRALSRTPGIRRIEADGTVQALDDATDHDFGAALARSDTPGLDGSGVGLCVVDTGVDPNHEQIAPRTVTFADFVGTATTAYDDHGHGTHVAAIAAGDGTGGASAATFGGVAPAAALYAAKVLDSSGNGSDSQVVGGVQWCAAQPGVDVITMSLGDPVGGDGTDALSLAVDAAVAAGITVVVAAGNSGDIPGTINNPGTARGAITVGAVSDHSAPAGTERHDDGIWLAAFSSRGPTTDGRTKPDVSGPGVTVTSAKAGTTSGYATYSGTSMATPYVAGAAVLATEAAPTASPAQIKAALTGTAVDAGPVGTDNDWGAGLVDVRAAVDAVRGLQPARTTPFPVLTHVAGTVPDNGSVDVPITIGADGVGVPLAATMTLGGSITCLPFFGCLLSEWEPDLDLELLAPNGSVVATSQCALSGISCGQGRQETIGYVPTVAGTYTLRAYAFTGSPNNGLGGSFDLDLSHGPVAGSDPPPPPPPAENLAPVADAGPDQRVKRNRKNKLATFTLDGSASYDPDGSIAGHRWTEGSAVLGTTARVTLTRPLGTYTFLLTVTDDEGATATDSVTVQVRR